MSGDNSPVTENDHAREVSPTNSDGHGTSKSTSRRKGDGRENSGDKLSSHAMHPYRSDQPQSTSGLTKKVGNRRRISRSTRSPDDESTISNGSSELSKRRSVSRSESEKPQGRESDRAPLPPSRMRERHDSDGPPKPKSVSRRKEPRSSDSLDTELRAPREHKEKQRVTLRGGEDENNVGQPSFNSSADSVGTSRTNRSRKSSSSTSKTEDPTTDESSQLSDKMRRRNSNSSGGSSKQGSSTRSRRSKSEREQGNRLSRSRSNRSPQSLKGGTDERSSSRKQLTSDDRSSSRKKLTSDDRSSSRKKLTSDDRSSSRKKITVSEDEIMALLGSTYDGPLNTGDEEVRSISPKLEKRISRSRGTTSPRRNNSPRRQNSPHRRSSPHRQSDKKRMIRRASNDPDLTTDKKERKQRIPPRRSRSDELEPNNGLNHFLEKDLGSRERRKGAIGSRSVASATLSGSRSILSTRSSQSRRRRQSSSTGRILKHQVSPDVVEEENLSDDMNNSDMINGFNHDDYDNDQESIDLDLATARENFAQQNANAKLQLHLNKTDELLYSVFPKHVANALRNGQKVEPENHELVTIFFSDIVGFTDISAKLDPLKISDMLDRLYNSFDALSDYHDVFKVETIGDAYMAVTNLTKEQPDHCKRITEFAIDAIRVANQTVVDEENPSMGFVNIRVGFHSGSVVSNVVGARNPRYCLFGDTVNTASRMESNSQKNRIHCSEISANLLRRQCPRMRIYPRGTIEVKGKGEMKTFWVHTEGSVAHKDKKNGTIRGFMKSIGKRG